MTQAEALGIASHPISGFNHEKATELLALPEGWNAIAAIVVGKRADASTLEGGAHDREVAPRTRHALNEVVIRGL
jgi:nitroreductase